MDAETLEMLRTSLGHVLAEDDGTPLAARLEALGWDEVVADDRAVALACCSRPRARRWRPTTRSTRWSPPTSPTWSTSTWARRVVVLPDTVAPGAAATEAGGASRSTASRLRRPTGADRVVVAVGPDAGPIRLGTVAGDHPGVAADAIEGFDPDLGLVHLHGPVPAADVAWADGDASEAWQRGLATARRALAAELVGVGRRTVAFAVAYAIDRRQYDRPIGSFQAVQHRLAEAHVGVVSAAGLVVEAGGVGDGWSALVAKCVAGRVCEEAARQAQQVFGAIGFTWEHDLHHLMRRGFALDALLGDWRRVEAAIGRRLRETGVVPRIGALWTDLPPHRM